MRFIMYHISIFCMLVTFVQAGGMFAVGDTIHGKVWVIDGDSIRLTHSNHTKTEVRIFGIDAPEYDTDAGQSAKYFLINTVKASNRNATCHIINIDRYQRYVSQCILHKKNGDIDMGLHMLKNNHAKYFGRYMHLKSVPQGLQRQYEKYKQAVNTLAIGDTINGKVWVIDGDSIRLTHSNHTETEIRIFGIDAPEYDTDAGQSAKYFLINTVKASNRNATCYIIDIDRYKRYVSQCTLHTKNGDIDMGLHMLKNNHAQYFGRYMHLKSVPQGLQKQYEKYK